MMLYHYTNINAVRNIIDTGDFKPSTNTAIDAGFGMGWYLTDLPPDSCEIDIYNECFGGVKSGKKIDYYIYLDIPDSYIKKCKNHIYLVPINYGSDFEIIEQGKKDECPNKPCITCPKYNEEKRNNALSLGQALGYAVLAGIGVGLAYLVYKTLSGK